MIRYWMDPSMFNAYIEANQCFCLNHRPKNDCDGWSDMSPCVLGLPIGFSFPHFFNSPRRQQEMDGLAPDKDKHLGYLEVEDNLGSPVSLRMIIQAVLDVRPVWSVSSLSRLSTIKLPIIWVELKGGVTDGLLAYGLAAMSNFLRYGSYGCLLLGLFGSSWWCWKLLKNEYYLRQQQQHRIRSSISLSTSSSTTIINQRKEEEDDDDDDDDDGAMKENK